jgi:hypothetical protein
VAATKDTSRTKASGEWPHLRRRIVLPDRTRGEGCPFYCEWILGSFQSEATTACAIRKILVYVIPWKKALIPIGHLYE